MVQSQFLKQGVELAREEMISNIETQSSKESGKSYPDLSYLINGVEKQPPRLILTGELFSEIKENPIQISANSAKLTIDPIDPDKGEGYASYHQEGENNYKDKEEFQAEFVTQSDELANKQINLLTGLLDSSFSR